MNFREMAKLTQFLTYFFEKNENQEFLIFFKYYFLTLRRGKATRKTKK